MNIRNRTPLIGTAAILAAALALPVFAQDAQSDAATQAQSPTSATGQPAQSGASGGGQTWADVDTDSDGAISKQEAQVNAGLSQIFAQADADHNGKLTPDEYKAYVAKQQQGGAAAGSNGQ
ncbi:EF-hand domain-containing protein [Xanthomonas bonasiae]|uniref:EF-hand domain-containing protein n=1 Tax=Xanthomonas bonasiae TaxID=2810351 RepID=UPI00177EA6BC|nr:EF-hand domain-containing protein [Xanthomonas surreyensis]MBD7922088.1 EF-hand domain-containing protein [Xanthomonas surreyensis]